MKIGANFIFKNEEHVLPRLLKSILPIVDCIYALDTGSTDNSVKIVEDFIRDNRLTGKVVTDATCTEVIEGETCFIYDRARNKAIDLIKGKCDFNFWIDADEQAVLPPDFDINKFKNELSNVDSAMSICNYNNLKYGRNCFFRNSKPFSWSHPIHELLECSEPIRSMDAPIEILIKSDGATWSVEDSKKKYLKHALVLKWHIDKFGDNADPRDVFYLAQSYKDAGEVEKALEWYKKRIDMNIGNNEEKFYSQFEIAILKQNKGELPQDVFFEYIKASELDNMRGEATLNAIMILRKVGLFEIEFAIAKYAVERFHNNNPYPNRVLFLDKSTYEYKILDAYKTSCEKLGRIDELSKYLDTEDTYNRLCNAGGDISEHLPTLKRYAESCNHVTELGFKEGCSIYALLMAKPKQLVSYDINYHINTEHVSELAKKDNIDFKFIQKDVLKSDLSKTDLLFIDTVGDYAQLLQELKLHSKKVRNYIIIHDTEVYGFRNEFSSEGKQGLQAAIEDFLSINSEWSLSVVYTNNNGLTILEKGKVGNDRIIKFAEF